MEYSVCVGKRTRAQTDVYWENIWRENKVGAGSIARRTRVRKKSTSNGPADPEKYPKKVESNYEDQDDSYLEYIRKRFRAENDHHEIGVKLSDSGNMKVFNENGVQDCAIRDGDRKNTLIYFEEKVECRNMETAPAPATDQQDDNVTAAQVKAAPATDTQGDNDVIAAQVKTAPAMDEQGDNDATAAQVKTAPTTDEQGDNDATAAQVKTAPTTDEKGDNDATAAQVKTAPATDEQGQEVSVRNVTEEIKTVIPEASTSPIIIPTDVSASKGPMKNENVDNHNDKIDDSIRGGAPTCFRRNDAPSEQTKNVCPSNNKCRRKTKFWTPEEEDALRKGVDMFGCGRWKLILTEFSENFHDRTNEDLRVKWRNIMKFAKT